MCLGIPAIVLAVNGESALVSINDVHYQANLSLVEDVKVGDFLIVHAGYAIEKLNEAEAQQTLQMFAECEQDK